ncbi:MAG: hypothetical protein WBF58_10710 [Xanthobacteraceae bacterium]
MNGARPSGVTGSSWPRAADRAEVRADHGPMPHARDDGVTLPANAIVLRYGDVQGLLLPAPLD